MGLLESGMLLFWPFIVVILIVGLLSFFTVQTAQVAVITRFGKFLRVAEPGLNWKWPFIDRVAGRVSLRVNQITLTMETKTKDNVFVTIPISVQNRVRPEKVYDAFYKLSDPVQQIQAYVEDGQDQHAVPVACAGRGARHFRTDHAVDAGCRAGEELGG
jgi:regulator of protease activity HflC (stomatin/prohibitin superfamily)